MNIGDVVKFKVHDTNSPDKEVTGRVSFVASNGVIRISDYDRIKKSYQLWEGDAELVSDEEAMLWMLENA